MNAKLPSLSRMSCNEPLSGVWSHFRAANPRNSTERNGLKTSSASATTASPTYPQLGAAKACIISSVLTPNETELSHRCQRRVWQTLETLSQNQTCTSRRPAVGSSDLLDL